MQQSTGFAGIFVLEVATRSNGHMKCRVIDAAVWVHETKLQPQKVGQRKVIAPFILTSK